MSFAGWPQTITNRRAESDVVKWVLADLVSRATGVIAQTNADQIFEIGTVFGKIVVGAAGAAAANAGNLTNDVVSAPTVAAGAQVGTYRVFAISAGATGEFTVYKPDGTLDGFGKVGTAYAGTIGFTVTDGATHLAIGEGWTIAVAAGSGKYVPLNLAATDGSQNAAAINYGRIFVPANTDVNGPLLVRWAAILSDPLIWPAGITGPQTTAALAQLAALNIFTLAQT